MGENILDMLRSQGILQDGLQEKVSNMIERYQTLDEDGKKEFIAGAKETLKKSLSSLITNRASGSWFSLYYQSHVTFIVAVSIVFFFLVFFVYKLFKCLSEREAKREEKKKNKQQKKKK